MPVLISVSYEELNILYLVRKMPRTIDYQDRLPRQNTIDYQDKIPRTIDIRTLCKNKKNIYFDA